jgi:hypothetical protein
MDIHLFMKLVVLSFSILISLFSGCKSVPEPVLPEVEVEVEAEAEMEVEALPENPVLSEDEIKIINEVIDHVLTLITRELKNSRDDMQICINNEFYLYRINSADSYETDLKNSEKFMKSEMPIDHEMILSFINRNTKKRNVDKDVKFKADFFWKGEKKKKNYFRITFSNIGFDKSNTKAIVHVCVDLPGWVFTEYVYLEKTNDNWAYVNRRLY